MGHKLIRKRITIYSHSVQCVFYLVHLFYLVHSHPNMAVRCDMLRYGGGTALEQKSKLKRNSARLSFDICPSMNRRGQEPQNLFLLPLDYGSMRKHRASG